uniref:Uncharacterized protein n=1 Tax=Rhodnius prolixus TaxID=13249 RepID=T1IGE1_RHOPR
MAAKFERAVVLMAMLAVCLTFIHARPNVPISCPGSGGSAPSGSAPSGSAPSGSAPSGSAPSGSAPSGSAPSGSAPSGSAPSGSATGGNTIQAVDYNFNTAFAGDNANINESNQNVGVGGNNNAPIAGIQR